MNFPLAHYLRMFTYGTSYRIASLFFDTATREKVLRLYSFVRVPDNMVDEIHEGMSLKQHYVYARQVLTDHMQKREQAYNNKNTADVVFGEYVELFQNNAIPYMYSSDFFSSMLMDCTLHRYHSYEQLDTYMYGSAAVVGYMMLHLMGTPDPAALPYAHALGDAMQLTNFLRDIKEDYLLLDRIYLPEEDLQKFDLCHDDIISFCTTPKDRRNPQKRTAFMQYMQAQIMACDHLYEEAKNGYAFLPGKAKTAVAVSAKLYRAILRKIERKGYDVFSSSVRTTKWEKVKVLIGS